LILVFFGVAFINNKFQIMQVPVDAVNYEFNLITIVTVFAGFSFSVLGLILSLSTSDIIKKLEETNLISDNCRVIYRSIISFIISFFLSLYFIVGIDAFISDFIIQNNGNIYFFLIARSVVFVFGICYMIRGIILFMISVKKMVGLMNYIFASNMKKAQKKIELFNKSIENIEKMQNIDDDEFDPDQNCFDHE